MQAAAGAEARVNKSFSARLKSCPDTNHACIVSSTVWTSNWSTLEVKGHRSSKLLFLFSRQQTHEHVFDSFGPGGGQRPRTGLAQDMQRAAGVKHLIITEAFFVTIEMNINFSLAYFQVR